MNDRTEYRAHHRRLSRGKKLLPLPGMKRPPDPSDSASRSEPIWQSPRLNHCSWTPRELSASTRNYGCVFLRGDPVKNARSALSPE